MSDAPHKSVARMHAAANTLLAASTDRYHANFPLANLKPSPANTRRARIDAAGASLEKVMELAIREGETLADLMERLEAHAASQPNEESQRFWERLASLAGAIYTTKTLVQSIVALTDGTIVAGERRWLACHLAGLTHAAVNQRPLNQRGQEKVARFMENENRDSLLAHETVAGVRGVVEEMVDSPNEVTPKRMSEIFGVGKTRASMYAAFCQLEDDDPVLAQLLSGEVTTLRDCYTLASAQLKSLRAGREAEALAAAGLPKPEPKAPAAPKAPKGPSVRINLPVSDRTRLFLVKLADTSLVPREHLERFDDLTDRWADLNNKQRSDELTSLLVAMIEAVE